jgi:hypothetical protein
MSVFHWLLKRFLPLVALLFVAAATLQSNVQRRTLHVGPDKTFARPSEAAAAAQDGDIVEIDAAVYAGDVAVWEASNLTLRGVGGRPQLKANGASAQGKATWVIRGNNVSVENIEFSGATSPDKNGAGIRQEGLGLSIRNCHFHDNEMGILTWNDRNNDVFIDSSEFAHSHNRSQSISHNIYIGNIRTFTLQFSYVHHAAVGHNVKSRARNNFILYNRIMDEQTGTSSYAIDLPNGGRSYVIGNLVQKGTLSENSALIAYAAEQPTNESQELYLVNNTMVSDLKQAVFVRVHGVPSDVRILNNIFAGSSSVLRGPGALQNNLILSDPKFKSIQSFDYRLLPGSPAVNRGIDPGVAAEFSLTPVFQYKHPAGKQTRSPAGVIDIGAYEYNSLP